MEKISCAVIGYGYWGKVLTRVARSSPDAHLVMVSDADAARRTEAAALSGVDVAADAETAFRDPRIQAVFIATPVSSHAALVRAALAAGKDVFVEKPMTGTLREAEEITRLAEAGGRVLMVDHPFLFTGSVRKMRELVVAGELGRLQYFDSERVNLGLLRADVNVLWDLAPHDISILHYLLGKTPSGVRAVASSHTGNAHAEPHGEIAHLHLDYPDGLSAHISVSWLSPVKIRKVILGGDRKMALFDDVSPSEKLKIYDHGVDTDPAAATPFRPLYRSGDVRIPKCDDREAMQLAVDHFVSCVRTRATPLTDARFGLEVVRVLDAGDRSLRRDGARISLP